MAAVRAMLEVGSYHEDPDFRAPPYDLGSFHEIAYRQDPTGSRGGAESFGIGFRYAGEKGEPVAVDATFTLGAGAAPKLSTVRWSAADVWVREHRDTEGSYTDLGCASGSWRLPPVPDRDRRYLYGGDTAKVNLLLGVAVESGMPGKLQPLHGDVDLVPTERDVVELISSVF